MKLSANEMVDMIYVLGESERNPLLASRIYEAKYPNRRHPKAKDFQKVKIRFETTYSVKYENHTRRKRATEGEIENMVMQAVVENPHTSTWTLTENLPISQSSVSRIIRKNKFHPYHIQHVQSLNENDHLDRQNFCIWIRSMEEREDNFCNNILFTDEATFKSDGKVNINNCHYYDKKNPHFSRQLDHQHRWSLNVWGGIVGRQVLGPHFFNGPLDGDTYLHFLQNELQLYLEDLPLDVLRKLWFQHDGAPPHNSRIVKDHLNLEFPRRWIGRGGSVLWPARSPDLSKEDFFLWGFVKNKIYETEVTTREDFMQRIKDAFRCIDAATLTNVNLSFLRRTEMCLAQGGRNFEHLL